MTNEEKLERLKKLQEQAAGMDVVPSGLNLTINNLMNELGLTQCDLDDGCINCGS